MSLIVLSACTGGGSGADDAASGASPAPATTATSTGAPDPGGTPPPAGALEGSWLTTSGGSAVALVVTGADAALFGSKGTVCSGTASAGSVRLTCTDGSEDRASGTVDSVGASTLKVTWDSVLGQETYQRAEGGKLPPGLPTAGLG